MLTRTLILSLMVAVGALSPPSTIKSVVSTTRIQHPSQSPRLLFIQKDEESNDTQMKLEPVMQQSRRNIINSAISLSIFLSTSVISKEANAMIPDQKSYSSNARNFDRLSTGDSSGGSLYNNSPSSASAARRRAMLGCKIDSSRREALKLQGSGLDQLSEKECNLKVMDGDSEFMLKALRGLDCPSCPYGIKGA